MSGALEASGGFEVPTPILNSPFVEPAEYWDLREGEPPQRLTGRRPAGYRYRDPRANVQGPAGSRGIWREMPLVKAIRARLDEWRTAERPGISRVTAELLAWWERDGRNPRLFYAQKEAVETIIFLTEARADFLTGVTIPRDDPGEERRAAGYPGFERRCCKMATGTGKSTVAAMLAAWSILNKQADRGDARFSDTVLIVCPNVTIRRRLGELDPRTGEASLYRTRDLVPPAMMADLARGRVLIKNWHEFEPGTPEGGGGARVVKAGRPETRTEWIVIGGKVTTARGSRYFTPESLCRRAGKGRDRGGPRGDRRCGGCAQGAGAIDPLRGERRCAGRSRAEGGWRAAEHPGDQRRGASCVSHPSEGGGIGRRRSG